MKLQIADCRLQMAERVLVFTPTYEVSGVRQMRAETELAIRSLTFDGVWEWRVSVDNPFPAPSHRNVLHQYQMAREMCLDGEWDALMTIEHDMLPPSDALAKMAATDADVVYAPYMLRHGLNRISTWRLDGKKLGRSLGVYLDELEQARQAVVWPVCGVGHGCTLIRRHVLEAIPFRNGDDGAQYAPDLPFALDCLEREFRAVGRFDVPVGHMDGVMQLWPFARPGSKRIMATRTTNWFLGGGRWLRLVAGHEIAADDEVAAEMIERGVAEYAGRPITA